MIAINEVVFLFNFLTRLIYPSVLHIPEELFRQLGNIVTSEKVRFYYAHREPLAPENTFRPNQTRTKHLYL